MWDTGKYMTHVFDEDGEWYVYDVSSNQVYEIDSAVAAVLQPVPVFASIVPLD